MLGELLPRVLVDELLERRDKGLEVVLLELDVRVDTLRLLRRVERGGEHLSVDAEHRSFPFLKGEAGDHAGLGRAGNGADDDRVEEDAELALLRLHLHGPAREAVTAERVV